MTEKSSSTAELDPATLDAIRSALGAARRGQLAEACATAERALADGGDTVALNAMLGMLRGHAGDQKGAIRHLEVAHLARPRDARIAANLASALATEGSLERALEVADPGLSFSDSSLQLARIRGYVAQMLERPAVAVEAYEHVVSASPDDWESLNNLGNARLATGDLEGGIAALSRSVELNPEAAPTQLNLARALRRSGDRARAEQLLLAMADRFPEDSKSLLDLHDLLKEQSRDDGEVLKLLQRALDRAPNDVAILLATARQHALLLDMDAAERQFRAVLTVDPANAEAFVGLAMIYEHHRPADLDALAEEAAAKPVDEPAINFVKAFAHRRANRFEEGLAALARVPEEFEPTLRWDLLGQFHDKLGQYDEAFAAFSRMNEAQAESSYDPRARAAELRSRIRDRLGKTTSEWFAGWKAPPVLPVRPSPIFLVGFPRSGTTLLDTMLMGHPDLKVMEERPALSQAGSAIGGFENIAGLEEAEVRDAQALYFREAAKYVDLGDEDLLVDKSPLLLNEVPVIHRLFPDARFILALRHPADSVLSCFVSNFRPNSSMANFLDLESAAEFYDLTFGNWEKSRSVFPLDVHTVAYEQLVEDPEAELRKLSDALGLVWSDSMLDHQRTVAARGPIPTASYAQVTEPVYRRSAGRWKHYRKQLEPILPVLAPWAEKFGYEV